MLFGYVFNISVVSAFINVFMSLKLTQIGGYFAGVLIPLGAVALLIIILRIKSVRGWINSKLEKLAGKIMHTDAVNTVMLIDHIGKGSIAQVNLKEVPEAYADVPLNRTGLKEEKNILVMLVEHSDLSIDAPTASTVFLPGDKLTVFGDYKVLCRTFNAKERFD